MTGIFCSIRVGTAHITRLQILCVRCRDIFGTSVLLRLFRCRSLYDTVQGYGPEGKTWTVQSLWRAGRGESHSRDIWR